MTDKATIPATPTQRSRDRRPNPRRRSVHGGIRIVSRRTGENDAEPSQHYFDCTRLVDAATWTIDVGKAQLDTVELRDEAAERKPQPPFYITSE
jgi:hypothetical protein